jgi:FMN phosphatase YigB (HAD superfamily)
MMDYSTLIFDAFDTVVHINESKLPTYSIDGTLVHTTAPAVHAAYIEHFGKLDFDVFYRAFSQSFTKVNALRHSDLREIPSQERFQVMLGILGHDTPGIDAGILLRLTEAHMAQLRQAFEVRPETVQVLDWAKGRFRTAMISNFGYAPTLYATLDHFGIRSAFETVVVSVEVGWCKPHRIIFERTLEQMAIQPSEALFIGDQLYVDVYGALNCGIDVVWIETERQDRLPEHPPKPTYTVRSLSEVIPLLEKRNGLR